MNKKTSNNTILNGQQMKTIDDLKKEREEWYNLLQSDLEMKDDLVIQRNIAEIDKALQIMPLKRGFLYQGYGHFYGVMDYGYVFNDCGKLSTLPFMLPLGTRNRLLNSTPNAQECDTTGDDSSNAAKSPNPLLKDWEQEENFEFLQEDIITAGYITEELLPCPFCGSRPLTSGKRNKRTNNIVYTVSCSGLHCHANLFVCIGQDATEARNEAVRKWNDRKGVERKIDLGDWEQRLEEEVPDVTFLRSPYGINWINANVVSPFLSQIEALKQKIKVMEQA